MHLILFATFVRFFLIPPYLGNPFGGFTERDVNDRDVQKVAKLTVPAFNRNFDFANYFELVKVTRAQTLVNHGVRYKLETIFVELDCKKPQHLNCHRKPYGKTIKVLIDGFIPAGKHDFAEMPTFNIRKDSIFD